VIKKSSKKDAKGELRVKNEAKGKSVRSGGGEVCLKNSEEDVKKKKRPKGGKRKRGAKQKRRGG